MFAARKKGGETTLPAPPDAMCMASEDRPSRQPYPCTIGNVQPLRDDVLYTHMANVSGPSAYKMYRIRIVHGNKNEPMYLK